MFIANEIDSKYSPFDSILHCLIKARLHIRFLNAFSALRCNFLLLTLIEQNQGNL